MPGNEFGDRVHNFFMPDNYGQGQHQSHVVEGNWMPNDIWVNGQRQIDAFNSSSSYTSQNSDIGRRQTGYPVNAANGLNFSQLDPGFDIYKTQSLNDLPYSNGFMHGDHIYQSRQNEANFLAVNTNSDNRHLINSRGLSIHEAQQSNSSGRLETSLPSTGFDLFGGQQQMSNQQASLMQAIQHQQATHSDMQILQQQFLIRKMQELQREQQLQQLDLRARDQINQASPFNVNASGGQSTLVSGTSNCDTLQFPRTERGTKWPNHGSSGMPVSSRGLFLPPNVGQAQSRMDLVPQQADQSLYGVPVSSSRSLGANKYSQMELNGSSMLHNPTPSSPHQGTQHKFLHDQNGVREGTSISRKKLQSGQMFVNSSNQLLNTGMKDIEGLEQVNSMQRNAHQQGVMQLQGLSDNLQERTPKQVASSGNEISLDPTEEKILYGSDDNIWDVLGKNSDMSGEVGNIFDSGGTSNGLLSLQSGSWSALMQSAVAETSSSDIGPQEEWSGVLFHNTNNLSANQGPSVQNNNIKQASSSNDNMHIPSAFGTTSMPLPADSNTLNVMVLNQLGHKFQSKPVQMVPTGMSHRFGLSLEEANKQSDVVFPQKPVAESSQMHRNASQHSFDAEMTGKTISAPWNSRQSGTREQPNDVNSLAAVPPGRDSMSGFHENAKPQNIQNNHFGTSQGELAQRSSLWKSNSRLSSNEFGHVKSFAGNQQETGGIMHSNDTTLVENSFRKGVSHETHPFVLNNIILNQRKDAHACTKSQGGDPSMRMLDKVYEQNQILVSSGSCDKDEVTGHGVETCPSKENSNDSHCSNLSQHASGGFRERRLSQSSDSRYLALGKQKSTTQFPTKAPVSHKFQYHPMGNLDDDEEPTYGRNQLSQDGLQKVNKASRTESSSGCYAPTASLPFSRPIDSSTSNKSHLQSRDMLELLHKVDQSSDRGGIMHLTSEGILPSQLAMGSIDGSAGGRLQCGQSSGSQGFGLQLGPPSQRMQTSDLSSSPSSHGMIDSMHTSDVGAEMAGKSLLRIPSSSVQSLPFPVVESHQTGFGSDRSTGEGYRGSANSLYDKMPRNNHLPFSSDTQYASNQLGNEQITSEKTGLVPHLDSLSGSTTKLMQRGSADSVLPGSFHHPQNAYTAPKSMSDTKPMHSSQQYGNPATSQPDSSSQVFSNVWTKDHGPEQAAQYTKSPSRFSELAQSIIGKSSFKGDLDVSKGSNISSNISAIHANSADSGEERRRLKESPMQMVSAANIDLDTNMKDTQGNLSSVQNHLDDSRTDSASVQKDMQAFGRSLKPNDFSNERYALLNRLGVLRDAESDSSIRLPKRMKGSNNNLDGPVNLMAGQQSESGDGNSLGLNCGVPSDKFGASSSPVLSDSLQWNASSHGNVAPQGIVLPNLDVSQNQPSSPNCASVRLDNQQVSPQMAPSWFNHYGNFKNGQMLPVINAHHGHHIALRQEESPHVKSGVLGNISSQEKITSTPATPVDACQIGGTLPISAPTSVLNEQLSSPQPFQINATTQDQVILRPNKRKIDTSQLHPWQKVTSSGSHILSTLSMAEADWSKALNCLPEKPGEDLQLIEDGHPLFRSKRRLILTTQLMQQLFCPPPATILSGDARSKFQSVTYAVSRLALGDACRSVSLSRDSELPPDDVDPHLVKGKLKWDPRFAQAIEELLGKATRLENDFFRVEKRASILELTVECQDLEKFSVINRFAKLHGRGQNDNGESGAAGSCVQRYISAVGIGRNILPPFDMVQCLSL